MYNIRNSSGKVIGKLSIEDATIKFKTQNKPELVIQEKLNLNDKSPENIAYCFTKYSLLVSEVAALFNLTYGVTNRILLKSGAEINKEGRRNSRFGASLTEETKRKIGDKSLGRPSANKGKAVSKEIRTQISNTLKQLHKEGKLDVSGEKQRKAWADGKYANVRFGRGFQGWFTSITYDTTFYFRSLLELNYILLWEDAQFSSLKIEPFRIPIIIEDKVRTYTPDALIDEKYLIEIKASKQFLDEKGKERYAAEILYAEKFCNLNNLSFHIATDKDIGFDTVKFTRHLKYNPQIIEKHNIKFTRSPFK